MGAGDDALETAGDERRAVGFCLFLSPVSEEREEEEREGVEGFLRDAGEEEAGFAMVDFDPLTGVAMVAFTAGDLEALPLLLSPPPLFPLSREEAERVFDALRSVDVLLDDSGVEPITLVGLSSGARDSWAFEMIVVPSALHTAVWPDFLSV